MGYNLEAILLPLIDKGSGVSGQAGIDVAPPRSKHVCFTYKTNSFNWQAGIRIVQSKNKGVVTA